MSQQLFNITLRENLARKHNFATCKQKSKNYEINNFKNYIDGFFGRWNFFM